MRFPWCFDTIVTWAHFTLLGLFPSCPVHGPWSQEHSLVKTLHVDSHLWSWDLGKPMNSWLHQQSQLTQPWLMRLKGWFSREQVFILVKNTGALFILKKDLKALSFPSSSWATCLSSLLQKGPINEGYAQGSYTTGSHEASSHTSSCRKLKLLVATMVTACVFIKP